MARILKGLTMARSNTRIVSHSLAVAILVAAPALQADTARVIYAAENALYGAGYDIGRADGWMDDTLRSAIRRYQGDTDGLQATGELDAQTLAALGASQRPESPVRANELDSPRSARAALDLPVTGTPARTAIRPAPAPAPVVSAPEPESEPEQEPKVASSASPEPVPAKEPERVPEVAIEPEAEPEASEESVAPGLARVQTDTEPAPAQAQAPRETSRPAAGAPHEAPAREPVAQVAVADESATPEPAPLRQTAVVEDPQPPTPVPEQVQAEAAVTETSAPSAPAPEARPSGGFFSALFDFLFGWLV